MQEASLDQARTEDSSSSASTSNIVALQPPLELSNIRQVHALPLSGHAMFIYHKAIPKVPY